MVLDVDRSQVHALANRTGPGAAGHVDVLVDQHAVVTGGQPGVGRFLAGLVVSCRDEIDVVGLPLQRWQAHVQVRILDLVNPAALVVLAGQPERVKDLHLVSALHVDAAVAAALTPTGRGVVQLELHVQVKISEVAEAGHSLAKQPLIKPPTLEVLGGRPVKEHDSLLGSLGSHRRTDSNHPLERARIAVFVLVENPAVLPGAGSLRPILAADQLDNVPLAGAGHRDLFLARPTRTGQSAGIRHADELALALGNKLQTDLALVVARGPLADILTLYGVVGVLAGLGLRERLALVLGRGGRHTQDEHQQAGRQNRNGQPTPIGTETDHRGTPGGRSWGTRHRPPPILNPVRHGCNQTPQF